MKREKELGTRQSINVESPSVANCAGTCIPNSSSGDPNQLFTHPKRCRKPEM